MGQRPSPLETLVMSPGFWRGKKVLITGHTGFKGSWLTLWLQKTGAEICGLSLPPPTRPSLYVDAQIEQGLKHKELDIRDFPAVQQAFTEFEPDVVFHLAAQPLVRYSYGAPIETFSTNVMGTVHLLEAARLTKSVRAFVNITSDKCYENREWVWGYRESEAMGGHDPYSSSKGCAELVTAAYRRSYFTETGSLGLASGRAGNVIGGGDWAPDRLIPDIMRAMLAGETVTIRRPNAIRPWQHVLEPLHGYLLLAEKLYEGVPGIDGAWNFGPAPEDAKPVEWIVRHLTQRWPSSKGYRIDTSDQLHEAHYLKLDCTKANSVLGWSPVWQLDAALERIIEWYAAYAHGADMRKATLSQIQHYEADLNDRINLTH